MKKQPIRPNSGGLIIILVLSLSITWDVIALIDGNVFFHRFHPLFQGISYAGYTLCSITDDINRFDNRLGNYPKRKYLLEMLLHLCAVIIVGIPTVLMWIFLATSYRNDPKGKDEYWLTYHKNVAIYDSKPLVVRLIYIPSALMLVLTLLIVTTIISDEWIPYIQHVIDALVSTVGLVSILASKKPPKDHPDDAM